MKSKARLLWIKLHTYFSCFFLPLTLLYIATGVLYLFDIEGGVRNEFEYEIALPNGWPTSESEAKTLMLPIVEKEKHGKLPPDFYLEDEYVGWYGYKQEIFITPTQDAHQAKLIVHKHDLWHQFLLIHKGHAGPLFWFFAIMLGASLVFSLISGLVIAIAVPKFRRSSVAFTVLGFFSVVFVFLIGK